MIFEDMKLSTKTCLSHQPSSQEAAADLVRKHPEAAQVPSCLIHGYIGLDLGLSLLPVISQSLICFQALVQQSVKMKSNAIVKDPL